MGEWIDLLDPGEEELRKVLPPQIHERALEQLLEPYGTFEELPARWSRDGADRTADG